MPSTELRHKPVVGYCDPMAVAPGEPIRFMVSTSAPRFTASVVRLRHGDPHPDGPGLRYEPVPGAVDGDYPGSDQPLHQGSAVVVDDGLDPAGGFTVQAWIYPTTPDRGSQGLLTRWDGGTRQGFGLFVEREGDLSLRLDDRVYRTGVPLRAFEWSFAAASYDPGSGVVTVTHTPLPALPGNETRTVNAESVAPPTPTGVPLVLGGQVAGGRAVGRFNGKLSAPRAYDRALTPPELAALAAGADPATLPGLVAAWDLVGDADSEVVLNLAGPGLTGRAVNQPMTGVTGHNWSGDEAAFHRAPAEYNAMFFHEDDLDDAGWAPAFEFVPPPGTRSGVYAMRLVTAEGAEDWVPFFVRPPRGQATADIVFLAPTLSYLAYANEHSAVDNPAAATDFDMRAFFQPEDHYAIDAPVVGLYDHHPDGTGVCYSTWRRPVVNMRPHYHLPLVRSAHQFPADLHLIDWLEEKGFTYDVITDHDLHADGVAALAPYRVVLTGSHPEYWSKAMLTGLDAYVADGGRLMYLGGNGFYWVTSVSPSKPWLIEVRRGRRGTGTWRSAPGEDFHSTTGEPGGLWRDRAHPPQQTAGVGMAAQGFDRALPYTREPGSFDPRASWIFEGVADDEPIGASGLVMGGAAGLEVDRLDHRLGTPPHALLLASARGFSDSYQHVIEEVDSSDSRQGGTVSPQVRADMVFYETGHGGAVFSTGSIAWCGSLSTDNPVSRITENVLRRFNQSSGRSGR